MLKELRQSRLLRLICASSTLFAAAASAQVSATRRQLERVDIAVTGVGEFTKSVQGVNYQGASLSQAASNTLGALVTIRYTKSPLLGAEFNYGYARYTENFANSTPPGCTPSTSVTGCQYIRGGAQTKAAEYTLGYVAHGPQLLGVQTFGSAGLGSIAFTPTPFGGQGLPERARAAYYYALGAETPVFSNHFGIRAQFRQVFFLAPDFGQNYLTIKKHTFTSEPGVGFYIHF